MKTISTNHKSNRRSMFLGCAIIMAVVALVVGGCQTSPANRAGDSSASATTGVAVSERTGAQLWAQNCNRCHNFRSPSSYSDAQWQVAMHHMRVRANLTAVEHKKILAFLKSAN